MGLARDHHILRFRLPRIWQVITWGLLSRPPVAISHIKLMIRVMNRSSACLVCGSLLKGRQSRCCSILCKNDYHQGYETQKRRGLQRKLELVQAQGGCCSVCGYRKNLAALTFHHTGASEKEFKLDMRSLSNRKLEPTLRELDQSAPMATPRFTTLNLN